jgi:hypothetical protein
MIDGQRRLTDWKRSPICPISDRVMTEDEHFDVWNASLAYIELTRFRGCLNVEEAKAVRDRWQA